MAASATLDGWASSAHENMFANLTAPFAGGAQSEDLPLDATGRAEVIYVTRDPLLVVAPASSLGATGLRVSASLPPGGQPASFGEAVLAPYTEAAAFLPLHLPGVDAELRTAAPFAIALSLAEIAEDGSELPVPVEEIAGRLRLQLIQGMFGRLLYAVAAEKPRLRRQARELAAMRRLGAARDAALDGYGAELGVPRFADRLVAEAGEMVLAPWTDADGNATTEPDAGYRRRLAMFRPFRMATRTWLDTLLNGPGAPGDANAGLMAGLGLGFRFGIDEQVNPFAVAVHLIAAGSDTPRQNFLDHIRAVHLLWPRDEPAANAVHAARALSTPRLAEIDALRLSLRQNFDFPAESALAPLLAAALDRVGRARRALGLAGNWAVTRAQDGSAGSRYELGLGLDLKPPGAAEVDALAAAVAAPPGIGDPEMAAMIDAMQPASAADDPVAGWFFAGCGVRTAYLVNDERLYLSHLPVFGLAIAGPSTLPSGGPRTAELKVAYQAPGDPTANAVIHAGLAKARADWAAAGGEPFTLLTRAEAEAAWAAAEPHAAADPPLAVFRAAGLDALTAPAQIAGQIRALPEELVAVIALPVALATALRAGTPAAGAELRDLTATLAAAGFASALPMTTSGNRVILTLGAIGLPGAGINLSDRRSTGFRWYAVPLAGAGGTVEPIGSRSMFTASGPAGLTAVVALGYARRPGINDPYEYRVTLPEGALLDVAQQEFLMNLLGEVLPMGVMVNTFALRRSGVDLDADGTADPLDPKRARSFRPFRQRRHRGLLVPPLATGSNDS